MTNHVPLRIRRRKCVGFVSPQRDYRNFLSKNYSPEVSAALVTHEHGSDWLVFGTELPA